MKIIIKHTVILVNEPHIINSLFSSDIKLNIVDVHWHIEINNTIETAPKNVSLISF